MEAVVNGKRMPESRQPGSLCHPAVSLQSRCFCQAGLTRQASRPQKSWSTLPAVAATLFDNIVVAAPSRDRFAGLKKPAAVRIVEQPAGAIMSVMHQHVFRFHSFSLTGYA